mgnify:CR=1 FL=1
MNWLRKVAFEECAAEAAGTWKRRTRLAPPMGVLHAQFRTSRTALNVLSRELRTV